MSATRSTDGTAEVQGELWGSHASDWAENEEQQVPTYEHAIDHLAIGGGTSVLELGCGSGVFLRAAADRGADVTGLDASEALLDLARTRAPEADLRLGDLQFLPFGDDTFDVVAGFNSFFFAADMVEAMREAGRVAKPGGTVVVQVWGRGERCDLAAVLQAVGPLRSSSPPPGPPLSQLGVLEGMAAAAGLTPRETTDVSYAIDYPDTDTFVRRMLSAGVFIDAVRTSGEDAVRAAIVEGVESFRTPDGGYRLTNEWHFMYAEAS